MKQLVCFTLLTLLMVTLTGCSTMGNSGAACADCCAPESQPTATSTATPAK